jgi:AcrR family transcriptional regulator
MNTEDLILSTARKHFVQNGYSAARMQDIADEAGINKALLHYYFRTKEKMYQTIVGQILDTLVPKLSAAMEREGTFHEKMDRLVGTYMTLLMENPDIPFFIMTELSQKREDFISELKSRASFFPAAQAFVMTMAGEMQAGTIRRMPPMQLFLNIMGMTVFPFMAKPVFSTVFDFSDEQFNQLMSERREEIVRFVDFALRPE